MQEQGLRVKCSGGEGALDPAAIQEQGQIVCVGGGPVRGT